jgi:transposase InsO family protein
MRAFVTAAHARYAWRNRQPAVEPSAQHAQHRHLRQQAAALQTQRRSVREQRRQEDTAWQALRDERRCAQALIRRHGISDYPTYIAQEQQWQALRQQRQATLTQRHQEDVVWRQERQQMRQALNDAPVVRTWRAILIVTDNCTRVCYGLPLFANGSQVSSEQVIAALTPLLPPDLACVISDRGTHFTAHTFAAFAQSQECVHVPMSRRRLQTNGIAERCVRTLKAWLRQHAWTSDEALLTLLAQFIVESQ